MDELRQRRPDQPWLIPIRFDDCAVPNIELGGGRNLATLTSADLFGEHRDAQTERLLTAIKRIFGHQPHEQFANLAVAPASVRPDGPS